MKFTSYILTFLAFISAAYVQAGELPNVIIILSDDYGWGSAGCYGANPDLIKTPHIDRLAKEGRRFTDANTTSSVCSPTRYSVMTGRYCWRTSLKHEVLSVFAPLHIETNRPNLARLFKNKGYNTAAIGKWHLGYGSASKTDYTRDLSPGPLDLGFDEHFAVPSNHGDVAGVYVENRQVQGLRSTQILPVESRSLNFNKKPYFGIDAPARVDIDVMPVLTNKAVDFIARQKTATPFFLYYTPVAIHNPVTPSVSQQGTSKAGSYGDWIHELDHSVGEVLKVLDQKGFTKDTLVLFSSDNGGVNKPENIGESQIALKAGLKISGPFRGGKHDVWEGGFRVPYIVRWPARVPQNTVCDETLSLVDTYATLAALTKTPMPDKQTGAEDSYNMLPAWLGEKYTLPIRPHLIVHSADGTFAIREHGWKWIEGGYHPETKPAALKAHKAQHVPQLYDIKTDIAETTDLTVKETQKVEHLKELLNRLRTQTYSR